MSDGSIPHTKQLIRQSLTPVGALIRKTTPGKTSTLRIEDNGYGTEGIVYSKNHKGKIPSQAESLPLKKPVPKVNFIPPQLPQVKKMELKPTYKIPPATSANGSGWGGEPPKNFKYGIQKRKN